MPRGRPKKVAPPADEPVVEGDDASEDDDYRTREDLIEEITSAEDMIESQTKDISNLNKQLTEARDYNAKIADEKKAVEDERDALIAENLKLRESKPPADAPPDMEPATEAPKQKPAAGGGPVQVRVIAQKGVRIQGDEIDPPDQGGSRRHAYNAVIVVRDMGVVDKYAGAIVVV